MDDVEKLEDEVKRALEKKTSLNGISDLISLAVDADPLVAHKAIYALYRVSVLLVTFNQLRASKAQEEDVQVVRNWLTARVDEFINILCGFLQDDQKPLRVASLKIIMSLLKHFSSSVSVGAKSPQLHLAHFRRIVTALLVSPPSSRKYNELASAPVSAEIFADVRDAFSTEWLNVYDDIRWFFLRETTSLLRNQQSVNVHVIHNALSFMERLTTMPENSSDLISFWVPEFRITEHSHNDASQHVEHGADEDHWTTYFEDDDDTKSVEKRKMGRVYKLAVHEALQSLPSHKAQFSACWLVLLSHLSDVALSTRALVVFHRFVMPHFTHPVKLMDWIGGCVDHGESTGLLALNALYQLMSEYNLDYPEFYTKLYAFLDRGILLSKHRSRFLRLSEVFLSSTHLPLNLLASFIKRMSRLALFAPPSAIISIVPLIYNILRRHPALMVMIHNPAGNVESDPFIATEPSPLLTNAILSSLWEIISHQSHYMSSVSTIARVFSETFTKPSYNVEDFLDHTYSTFFDADCRQKLQSDPALSYKMTDMYIKSGDKQVQDWVL